MRCQYLVIQGSFVLVVCRRSCAVSQSIGGNDSGNIGRTVYVKLSQIPLLLLIASRTLRIYRSYLLAGLTFDAGNCDSLYNWFG